MKKLILMTLFIIGFVSFGIAQQSTPKTPEERAEHQTKKWTKTLNLSADQSTQAKAAFLDHAQKVDGIKSKYATSTDKKAMHGEEKAAREQLDASLKNIFTPDQYNTYTQMKEEKKEQHKQKKATH